MLLYIDQEDRLYKNIKQKELIESLSEDESTLFKKNGVSII
jgi:hypothetical protein